VRRTGVPLFLGVVLAVSAGSCGGNGEEVEPPAGRLVVSSGDDLYTVGADGSSRRAVVTAPGPQFDGDWSPDGDLIAYRDSRSGVNVDDEIYVAGADGSDERNLTRDPGNDWSPAWSPDGDRIAFASDREGELRIFVMAADGSGVRRMTEIWGEYPAWSPDGERIAFASFAGGAGPTGDANYDLYVVDVDGGGLRRLTDNPAYDMYPTWSPDGESIAFESTRATPAGFEPPAHDPERTADFDVFVMPAQGGEARNVTRDPARLQKFPDWSPDGRWLAVDEEGRSPSSPWTGRGCAASAAPRSRAAFPPGRRAPPSPCASPRRPPPAPARGRRRDRSPTRAPPRAG
jgi:Tol biopolymer transport system component